MKKLLFSCFLISGFAVAENLKQEMCPPEDLVFVPITTSCGEAAVASGCTTQQIIDDTAQWEEFHCGGV